MQENSPLLQLQNVGYLAGDAKILNNINFSLRAGEFKLITGPSGCGKSTLLKIVASLISPTSGTLLFEGEDVSTLKPEIYRQQVSYCAQTPTLFGDTVYDNLIFPWQIRNQQPDPAIGVNQQVRGLEVAMHHQVAVRMEDGSLRHFQRAEPTAVGTPVVLQGKGFRVDQGGSARAADPYAQPQPQPGAVRVSDTY